MTKFIIGKANSDIAEKIRSEIISILGKNGEPQNIIYIVPDQFEFETEKAIYRALKANGLLGKSEQVHIRTFSSLSEELIKLLGDKKPTADDIAKSIIMHRVIKENKDSLRAFSRVAERAGFCEKMVQTVTMLKTAGISPDDLSEEKLDAEKELPDGTKSLRGNSLLRAKLADVGLIYGSYNARLTKDYFDSLDLTAAAAELITNSDHILFDDAQVFIDGFNDFTISQLHFLSNVIAVADNVTLGFVTEYSNHRDPGREMLFSSINSQIDRIKQSAEENESETAFVTDGLSDRYPENSPLHSLTDNIFGRKKSAVGAEGHIETIAAADVSEELDYTAARIKQLAQESGIRYRDIAVLCTDPKAYRSYVLNSFGKYGVPVFCDIPEPILYHPLVNFVMSLLNVLNDFSAETVLSLVKTGFLSRTDENGKRRALSKKDIDVLETYIFEWAISGEALKHPFDIKKPDYTVKEMNDDIREIFEKRLNEPEEIRRAVVEPVLRLRAAIKGADGAEMTERIFRFIMEETDINAALYSRCCDAKGKVSDPSLTGTYQRLWDTLAGIFDALYNGLRGDRISLADYTRLFRDICAGTTLAKPPQFLDSVLVGDINRTRTSNVKAVFILGASADTFPSPAETNGVFSPFETDLIRENITHIESVNPSGYCIKSTGELYCLSLYRAYRALSLPSEFLCVSCPETDLTGRQIQRSEVMDKLVALFPDVNIKKASDGGDMLFCRSVAAAKQRFASGIYSNSHENAVLAETLAQSGEEDFVRRIGEVKKERTAQGAAPRKMPAFISSLLLPREISATKMENLDLCSFMYLCLNGLRVRQTIQRSFNASQRGNAVHFIMQRVLESYHGAMSEFFMLDRKGISALAKKYLAEYRSLEMSGAITDDKRFGYLYDNIAAAATDLLIVTQAEFASREYRPEFFELNIAECGTRYFTPENDTAATVPPPAVLWCDEDGNAPEPPEKQHGENEIAFNVSPLELTTDSGEKVRITGVVDRVDIFSHENRNFIRVVDYKTGMRAFTRHNAEYGINTQMLTYLFALCEANKDSCLAGGVSYTPAKISGAISDKTGAFTLLSAAHRQSGMYVYDADTAEEMNRYADSVIDGIAAENGSEPVPEEKREKERAKFLPPEDNIMDRETDFTQFRDRVMKTLTDNLNTVFGGDFTAMPLKYAERITRPDGSSVRKNKKPCDYCRFAPICGNGGKVFTDVAKAEKAADDAKKAKKKAAKKTKEEK
ncbi:MAG: PD-(D/E)XK nuclease family protein [Oscillospiraceae bacterium]